MEREWKVGTDVIDVGRSNMMELFDPSIHLLKPLIEKIFSIMNLKGPLVEWWKQSFRGGVMVKIGARRSLLPLSRGYRMASPGGPSMHWILIF